MEKLINAKEVLSSGWGAGRSCCSKLACLTGLQVIGLLTALVLLTSCTTIKKAGVTSLATGAAVTVATALSSGATVPILAATTTAFVASAVTDRTIISPQAQGMSRESDVRNDDWASAVETFSCPSAGVCPSSHR